MIDFHVGEEETLLIDEARRFAAETLRPGERDHEAAGGYPADLVRLYEELGFARLGLPEALEGMDAPLALQVGVWSALAAGDPAAPLGLTPWAGAGALATTPAGAAWVDGGRPGVMVTDDGLRLQGDRVSGLVSWVPGFDAAWLVVISDDAVRVVEAPARGPDPHPGGLKAAGGIALTLDDADAQPIGDGELGRRILAEARILVAAVALGAARDSYEYSMRYAQERVVFGKPVAHHQAIAFDLADTASALDGADLLLGAAATRPERSLEVANAYVHALEAAEHVADRGVQLLGGHGYLYDHPVEKRMRDIRALACLYGGTARARAEAAALILDAPAPLEASP